MKNTLTLKKIKTLPTPKNPKLIKKLILKSRPEALSDGIAVLVNDNGDVVGAKTKMLLTYEDRIKHLIRASSFKGKLGDCVTDFAVKTDSKQPTMPIMLIGVGKYDDTTTQLKTTDVAKIANTIYKNAKSCLLKVSVLIGKALNEQQVAQFSLALLNASYRFDKYKSDKSEVALKEIGLVADNLDKETLAYVTAVFKGQSLTRDVANEPGNVCFPKYMAKQAQQLAKAHSDVLKVTVLSEKKMEQLGMGCFMAVSRGSAQEGHMVILEYSGHSKFADNSVANLAADLKEAVTNKLPLNQTIKKFEQGLEEVMDSAVSQGQKANAQQYQAPIALVGKGVTFDTGGISLKPGAGMEEMKFDMGGAASVLGTIKALCESRLPINVVGVLACAENMPAGNATRPGDIVRAMDGTSVEILNTDAEGRLVLADALCYVQRYHPKVIVDVATLTGACVIALGHLRSAVYSNNEDVLFELENASEQTGDLIWHMPLDDAYHEQLKSPIADLQNIGGRPAGSITAASFLSSFIKDNTAWAHLDIAGTAWVSGKDRNATGRPVPLFMQYLKNMAGTLPSVDKDASQSKPQDSVSSNETDNANNVSNADKDS